MNIQQAPLFASFNLKSPAQEPFSEDTTLLSKRITDLIQKELLLKSHNYWKLFCCFCPKLFPSRIAQHPEILTEEISTIFQNSLRTHVFKHSPLGIVLLDKERALLDCNDVYLSMIGYPKQVLIGQHYLKRPLTENDIDTLKEDSQIELFEFRNTRQDGTTFYSQISVSKIHNLNGEIAYFIAQVQDISQNNYSKENLEQILAEQGKKIEEQQNFINRLTAINSHEMRTSIGGIVGYSRILNEDGDSLSSQEASDLNQSIYSESQHLLEILNDNIDFIKIREEGIKLTYENFFIADFIEEVRLTHQNKLHKNGTILFFDIGENVPSKILGDKNHIRQAIEKILSHTIKFTKNGRITVSITNETMASERTTDLTLKFEFIDTGDALSPELLKRLFKPCPQESFRQRGPELGLVIAKELVESMGGKMLPPRSPVHASKGANFAFHLKVEESTEESTFPKAENPLHLLTLDTVKKELIGKRILIAEDSIVNQKMVTRLLRKANMSYEVVGNGNLAVEKLQADPNFDLVLMDIQMPIMDGLTATKKIREELHLLNLPILALTANGESYKQSCLDAGMNGFSEKPYNEEALFFKMHQLITQLGIVQNKSAIH